MSKTEKTQELAAAKAGMDVKTARKYLASSKLPSEGGAALADPHRPVRARLEGD